jgi:hypothetical protein
MEIDETIEEAFDRIFDSIDYILFDYTSFEQGAKWQKEQDNKMYSEEDMMDYSNYRLLIKKALNPKEWFEQFKNK